MAALAQRGLLTRGLPVSTLNYSLFEVAPLLHSELYILLQVYKYTCTFQPSNIACVDFPRARHVKRKLQFLRRRHTDSALGESTAKLQEGKMNIPSREDAVRWSRSFENLLSDKRE